MCFTLLNVFTISIFLFQFLFILCPTLWVFLLEYYLKCDQRFEVLKLDIENPIKQLVVITLFHLFCVQNSPDYGQLF